MTIIRKADFLRKELEIPLSHPVLSTCTSVLFLEKNDVDKMLLLHLSKIIPFMTHIYKWLPASKVIAHDADFNELIRV